MNILLIMTDQQRADSLGCNGNKSISTPHLDRLAAEGVCFDRAYCTNPICTPSRASLMTGHHLPRHGVDQINSALADHHIMFPQRLRELGYRTGLVGKLHAQGGAIEHRQRHPNDGFDVYEMYYGGGAMMASPLNAYAPWVKARRPDVFERLTEHEKHAGAIPRDVHMNTWATHRCEAFLDDASRSMNQPFFLMVSVFDPHNPYNDHPESSEARVRPELLPPLIPPPADRTSWPDEIRREAADNYFGDFRDFTQAQMLAMRVGYHAEVAMIDDMVGQIINQLESRGLLEETLIVFCSDHGDQLGDHGLMVKGGVPYEANIRVPALIRFPAVQGRQPGPVRGRHVVHPIQLNDLTALMLSAAGMDADEITSILPDAIDPTPALIDHSAARRRVAINAYRNTGFARGHVMFDPPIHLTVATDGQNKLAIYHGPPTPSGIPAIHVAQQYDLIHDPDELVDVYGCASHHQAAQRLHQALDEFLVSEARHLAESDK